MAARLVYIPTSSHETPGTLHPLQKSLPDPLELQVQPGVGGEKQTPALWDIVALTCWAIFPAPQGSFNLYFSNSGADIFYKRIGHL